MADGKGGPNLVPPCFPGQVEIAPGVWMPRIGYGTAGMGDYTREAVLTALQTGYRHIDTAQVRQRGLGWAGGRRVQAGGPTFCCGSAAAASVTASLCSINT